MKLAHLPLRVATGAYILNSGLSKQNLEGQAAEGVHGMAAGGAQYFLNEADIILAADDAVFFDPHALEKVDIGDDIPPPEAVLRKREQKAIAGIREWRMVRTFTVPRRVGPFVGGPAECVVSLRIVHKTPIRESDKTHAGGGHSSIGRVE